MSSEFTGSFWFIRPLFGWQIAHPAKKNSHPGSRHGLSFAIQFSAPQRNDTPSEQTSFGNRERTELTNSSANEGSLEKAELPLSRIYNPQPRDSTCWELVPEHRSSPDSAAECWRDAFHTGRLLLKTSNSFLRTAGFCGLACVGFFLTLGLLLL